MFRNLVTTFYKIIFSPEKHFRGVNIIACRPCSTKAPAGIVDFSNIANNDEEIRKLKKLRAELEYDFETNKSSVDPELIKPAQWMELLSFTTKSQKYKYLHFLKVTQDNNKKFAEKKAEKQRIIDERGKKNREEKRNCDHIYYGLGGNTLFPRIRKQSIIKWQMRRLIRSSLFGQKLLIDCSYDDRMTEMEKKSAGRQLFYSIQSNQQKKNPFNLQLFNVNFNETPFKTLQKQIPLIREKRNPMLITENCFTARYAMEKENLLYLSPDSENVLSEYNPNDIYVIGAMVDKGKCEPLSLRRANSLGIRHARLPLDEYVKFHPGSHKRLNIDIMLEILLCWRDTNDWKKAFEKIQRYKLADKRWSQTNKLVDI